MADLYIPLLLGTGHEGRWSEHAAKFVLEQIKTAGIDTELFDVRDHSFPETHGPKQPNDRTAKWREAMARADGLVIVTPEYNHGYPGELKIMLDALYKEYFHKPVAFCGVSDGALGGARCVEQLRQVVVELHMVAVRDAVYFMNCDKLFAGGTITDPAYVERCKPMIAELLWYARALKPARLAK